MSTREPTTVGSLSHFAASIQAQTNLTYELQSLGWSLFQDFAYTVMASLAGPGVQYFSKVRDSGADASFSGPWDKYLGGVAGYATVQAKFTERRDANLALSDVIDETKKAAALARLGLASNYLIVTNCGVSNETRLKIKAHFQEIPGVIFCDVYGCEWLTKRISSDPHLRSLVPRVYGLGDLTEILDQRVYGQTEAIFGALKDDLDVFVATLAYREALSQLEINPSICLVGDPGSGKTTLGAALALSAIDQWDCIPIRVISPEDFRAAFNPNRKQFFWVDDVFGDRQCQPELIDGWRRTDTLVVAAMRAGSRVVFTSRTYIFEEAKRRLLGSRLPFMRSSECVISVGTLTVAERQQILYSHIRAGDQSPGIKELLYRFVEFAAGKPSLTPEIARRLGRRQYTVRLPMSFDGIARFIDEPRDLLFEVFSGLDRGSKAALLLLYIHDGKLLSPVTLQGSDTEVLARVGAQLHDVVEALGAMRESFVRWIGAAEMSWWIFKHPTIKDAIAQYTLNDPNLLDVYLRGAEPRVIAREVACAGVTIAGAPITIPRNLYDLLYQRVVAGRGGSYMINQFLADRANNEFLAYVALRKPRYIDELLEHRDSIGSIRRDAERRAFSRFYLAGLVSEEQRLRFANEVIEYSLAFPDSSSLADDSVSSVLSNSERTALIEGFRRDVIPRLEEIREEWTDEWLACRLSVSPQNHFRSLLWSIERLRVVFNAEPEVCNVLSAQARALDDNIDNLDRRYNGDSLLRRFEDDDLSREDYNERYDYHIDDDDDDDEEDEDEDDGGESDAESGVEGDRPTT